MREMIVEDLMVEWRGRSRMIPETSRHVCFVLPGLVPHQTPAERVVEAARRWKKSKPWWAYGDEYEEAVDNLLKALSALDGGRHG